MATEFTIVIQDRPGALADLTEVLAQNAVNILAIHASPCTGQGVVQFVADNPDATIEALKDGGFDYTTHNVLFVGLVHQPGALARLARALANAAININAVYITMTGQLVLDVSDLSKAQQVAMSAGLY
ncbi:MAG: ACT domain-containing protein [Anaerolineae bacterium]|nr:ACT domain-containing protein [Anaerolineae bacterium]MEB2287930.1 ACT domain-containing protein [Anaerolineae bacterium]